MLYTTPPEEANDLGRSSSCERVIQAEKMTNYQNIIGGCFAGTSKSEGPGNGFYTGTKLFAHFSAWERSISGHSYSQTRIQFKKSDPVRFIIEFKSTVSLKQKKISLCMSKKIPK